MKTPSQRKSKLQEKRIANDVGGRVQPGSGAPDFSKGDVRKVGELRVEAKTTSKKSFGLKLKELQKIAGEALSGGVEGWAMQIEFQGSVGTNKKYAVLDWYEYLQLMEDRKALGNRA